MTIKNGVGRHNKSPVDCIQWLKMFVSNSRFYNNTSIRGGAISAQTDIDPTINDIFIVEISTFINNTAESAGAIFVSNHIMEIRYWNFEANRASKGDGGSLYIVCPDFDHCEYNIYSNSFMNNIALYSGGAIKWDDIMPYNLTDNLYSDNLVLYGYGNDRSSYPVTL